MFTRSTLFLIAALATACGGGSGVQPVTPVQLDGARVQRATVNNDDFAPLVKALLLDPQPSEARLNLLAGAVRHQLLRAGRYFDASHEEAGLAATTGALLLVRAGELRAEMFEGTEQTLLDAAAVVARLGDEGRTEAYYRLARGMLEGQARREADTHLRALEDWRKATRPPGSMAAAAAAQRSAVERSLVERTPQTLAAARKATIEWIERAFEEWSEEGAPTSQFEYDERAEGNRARVMGSLTLAALYLRDGDAAGAISAMETESVAGISNSKLVNRLNYAASGDADAWADLFGSFAAAGQSQFETIAPELAQAAAWGSAVALYRVEPETIRAAIPISALLVEHGMADVAPLVLKDVLAGSSDPRELNWALRLLFQALVTAEQNHDLELARQIYANSAPLLALAESKAFAGRVRPSASDFSYLMGAMESRAGELARARAHLSLAAEKDPNSDALRLLSAIDRQRGQTDSALGAIDKIIALSRSEGDATAEAEAQLSAFSILCETGDVSAADAALASALSRSLVAREQASSGAEVAAAERVLADVLSLYGEDAGAERATTRAFEAASNNLRQLTATLLDAARRALVNSDLAAGRLALRRALDADLEDNDLVYAALWVKLLHERLGVPSDGTVEEALARIDRGGGWASVLRDWAKGSLSDAQLVKQASSDVERVEAEFYATIGDYLRNPGSEAKTKLEQVAKSPAIELIEVRIAQELTAPPLKKKPSLPEGVVVP